MQQFEKDKFLKDLEELDLDLLQQGIVILCIINFMKNISK